MLHYSVHLTDVEGHYFDVSLRFSSELARLPCINSQHCVLLTLPAWIPGSYLIRDFARHLVSMASKINGEPVLLEQQGKDSWAIRFDSNTPANATFDFEATWRVYAWDLSVRGAHLDSTHGFFNGSSLFLCPTGFEDDAIELSICSPSTSNRPDWIIGCGLRSAPENTRSPSGYPVLTSGGSAKFSAFNYDALIDHPVEMGVLHTALFVACGVTHHVMVYGADSDVDLMRLCNDLKPVCEAQIRLFEPEHQNAPFDEYWFLIHATDKGYGGLEHRNSTALLCASEDLPQCHVHKAPKGYETFLGLCSHEYFHAWNVKRMKPAVFVPYRLDKEAYTGLLWIFEGFTSYYDDLMLARAGSMDETVYLKALEKTIANVQKHRGRLVQSAAASSFDAWTKYYRQDENAPNSVVSYYTKGALIGLCLDVEIRQRSAGLKSLDDVMRLMWLKKGDGKTGLHEHEFALLVRQATGVDVSTQIERWAYSCAELPLTETFEAVGYTLSTSTGDDAVCVGMTIQFKPEGGLVKNVLNESPAHKAGVSAGDVLVALNEKKFTATHYSRVLQACRVGDAVRALGFRAERLMQFDILTAAPVPCEWSIKKQEGAVLPKCKAPWLV